MFSMIGQMKILLQIKTIFERSPMKLQERYICKRIDKMICVSHAAAEYFAKEYKIPMPDVITNCSLKSEQAVADEKNPGFEVLNHGQFYAGRGYDIMVEASQYLKDYPEIKLAMRGFGVMEQQLRDRAEELQAVLKQVKQARKK